MKRFLWFVLLALLTIPVLAQDNFTQYSWTFVDISLRYPSSWDEPVQRFETETGRVNLLLAQTLVDSPDTRPPAIPFITVSLLREVTEETDIYSEIENDLGAIGINAIGALPGNLLGAESVATRGLSNDGELFGIAQGIELDDGRGILIIYGRTGVAQRDSFVALFNAISNSLNPAASGGAAQPEYGVLWHQSRTIVDPTNAYLNLGGIALAPDGFLYAVDGLAGLLQINPETGLIDSSIPIGEFSSPTDIVIASDNTIYVSDLDCNCVHVIANGTEISTITGFDIEAPLSMGITGDNTLYITDHSGDVPVVNAYVDNFQVSSFDIPAATQPFLAVNRAGELIALADNGIVFKLLDGVFTEQYQLTQNIFPTAITVDFNNNLVVATAGDGILVFDATGNVINQISLQTDTIPQAGETLFPAGIVASADDTIYFVDSDGSFGNITAMSLSVETGRVGSSNLNSGNVVEGVLDDNITRQVWTFDAERDDIITLTAIADFFTPDLDLAIRLLAPDGREIAYVDNLEESLLLNPFDSQIDDFDLNNDGQYIIIVERIFGIGRYQLGLNISEIIDVSSGQVSLVGTVSEAIPVQRWIFDGQSGQAIEITMESTGFTLDPYLTLISPNGAILAENDDALDPALGLNAQISDLNLPANGLYIIEAQRFDGEGNYALTLELE